MLNALAAIGLATRLGVPFDKIREALESFRGARRRFESKYQGENFQIIDDYGHHPTEIMATLATARALHPGRLLCLFQPHRFSRTQLLKKEFGAAFMDADVLCVTDVYAASEKPLPGVSGETIVEEVRTQSKTECHSTPTLIEARDKIGNMLRPGDLLITLGAGNVHEVGRALARDLAVVESLLEILNANGGGVVKLYEPMANHTTIRIGGPAQYWIEPRTVTAFQQAVRHLRFESDPFPSVWWGAAPIFWCGMAASGERSFTPARGEFDAEVSVNGKSARRRRWRPLQEDRQHRAQCRARRLRMDGRHPRQCGRKSPHECRSDGSTDF